MPVNKLGHTTVLAALHASGFFSNLSEEDLRLIRPAAKRVNQPRNTVVFHEGEPCHGFYIVESGAIKLYKESADAREHVLHIALPGDCFGEAALFLGTGYPASASAVKDSSLILLRKDEFLDVLRRNPEVAFSLMASMATWAHRLVQSIEALTLKDAGARFASYLLSKTRPNASAGALIDLGITKQVLASHLGMTSETLSRLLARFEADGLIEVQGRKIRLNSVGELRKIAESGRSEPGLPGT
ncbi:MAG: Crp/Fnr family transcriptional regulator [Armatimonadota bacterium]